MSSAVHQVDPPLLAGDAGIQNRELDRPSPLPDPVAAGTARPPIPARALRAPAKRYDVPSGPVTSDVRASRGSLARSYFDPL
jgi:hypothetical protein